MVSLRNTSNVMTATESAVMAVTLHVSWNAVTVSWKVLSNVMMATSMLEMGAMNLVSSRSVAMVCCK